MPIVHFVVDSADGSVSHLVEREPVDRHAPARERHTQRDLGMLLVAWLLAILGSVGSAILYFSDAPEAVLWSWVLVADLGLKIVAWAIVWVLFQRRARADRLDF